jgi:hypothetical protein
VLEIAASVIFEHSDCDGRRAKARNKINIPSRGHKWPLFHVAQTQSVPVRGSFEAEWAEMSDGQIPADLVPVRYERRE